MQHVTCAQRIGNREKAEVIKDLIHSHVTYTFDPIPCPIWVILVSKLPDTLTLIEGVEALETDRFTLVI